ncbi:MAG TPA: palindromic element RPE4 domain-containing protein [Rickettsia endosymbiont of Columbicola hoogstraali]|nr:palindromic element RPE4 domain-containing protein [Rickettsia endosymbiont of Columbicola hoogstraali]
MLLVFFIVFLDTVVKPWYDSGGTPRNDVFFTFSQIFYWQIS